MTAVSEFINTTALGPIQRGKVIKALKSLEVLRWQTINRVPSFSNPGQTIDFIRITIPSPIKNPVAQQELLTLCATYAVLTKDTYQAFLVACAAATTRSAAARILVDKDDKPITAPAPEIQAVA